MKSCYRTLRTDGPINGRYKKMEKKKGIKRRKDQELGFVELTTVRAQEEENQIEKTRLAR